MLWPPSRGSRGIFIDRMLSTYNKVERATNERFRKFHVHEILHVK